MIPMILDRFDIQNHRNLDGGLRPSEGRRLSIDKPFGAGWSSPVARQAHNLKVTGSNPVPATK